MKTSKKLLSVLLAVLMLASCFALVASAAEQIYAVALTCPKPAAGGAFPTKTDVTCDATVLVDRIDIYEKTSDTTSVKATAPFEDGKTYEITFALKTAKTVDSFVNGSLTATVNGESCNAIYLTRTTANVIWNVTVDSYNWKPIPTSPAGLNKGDYWLDWTYVAQALDGDTTLTAAELLQIFNDGTYWLDEAKADMKGTFTISAGMAGLTEDEVTELKPGNYDTINFLRMSLTQVGLEWKPISLTGENLKDGDYYLDIEVYIDAFMQTELDNAIAAGNLSADTTMEQYWEKFRADEIEKGNVDANITMEAFRAQKTEEFKHEIASSSATYFINPLDTKLLKVKLVEKSATAQTEEKTYIYPLDLIAKGEDTGYYMAFISAVKQYKAQTPEEPQPDPNMCHWCGKVHEGFFQKIIGFFHNILARIFGNKY